MSSRAVSIAVALAVAGNLTPAVAKLTECAASREPTGIAPCEGIFLNTDCPVLLLPECDWMYSSHQYSSWGIPCGLGQNCVGSAGDIAWPSDDYSEDELEALSEFTGTLLKPGSPVRDDLLSGNSELELTITEPSSINVTFVDEGACHRNALGLMTWDGSVDPRTMKYKQRKQILNDGILDIFLPNVDFEFCVCGTATAEWNAFCGDSSSATLTRGATMKLKPNFREEPDNYVFPAGIHVSFFLIPDAFDAGLRPGMFYEDMAESILFSTPMLNNPDFTRKTGGVDKSQHAIAFRGPNALPVNEGAVADFSDKIFFAFEDVARTLSSNGDEDFEDAIFFVDVQTEVASGAPAPPSSFVDSSLALPRMTFGQSRPGAPPALAATLTYCSEGILSVCGNVCCAASCGSCGGCADTCSNLDGGAENCCPKSILFTGIPCIASSDVACVVEGVEDCGINAQGCDNRD